MTTLGQRQISTLAYEGAIGDGDASWYVQGGPAIKATDGAENQTIWTGKIGAAAALSSSVDVYGELSAATADGDFDAGRSWRRW